MLPIYDIRIEDLRPRFATGFRLLRDKTASAVPVGMLYDDVYHTVVVAPATSNTVAKCVVGISDTLPSNMFAQAGKLGIASIVFACDTEPVVITKSPHDWVTLHPRRIELDNVERAAWLRALPRGVFTGRTGSRSDGTTRTAFAGMEHIVFLTGHLAEPQLHKVLAGITDAPFTWEVRDVGVQVAALMTTDLIRRRVPSPLQAQRMIVPGRCRGDIDALTAHYALPVQRGPEEMKDLPQFFNRQARPVDLSQRGALIFAEIVDAPRLSVAAIVERARTLVRDGADVIDVGCLPETPFAHLEDKRARAEG